LPYAACGSLAQEVRSSRRHSPKPHAPRPVTGSPHRVRSKPSRELVARRYVRHAPSARPEEPELTPVKGIDSQTIREPAVEAPRHHADQRTQRASGLADGAAKRARDPQCDRGDQKQSAEHPVLREGSNVEAVRMLEHAGSDPEQMPEASVDAAGMSS